ncbi:isochorismate synthase [Quadrisphaera granulorum]|uniref:isochorismate synthase n=1 Tax=Quadrisphaera granulorum TaxID=317664 RepID=A0A316AD37_9ACTN|nr:isochorismate synthase [Quadrisphaera granulorum]PWJ55512.1 isochorismate synthase [Quadrisphaera granulorum]SZE95576.1 isochorismate synthase [Quadrisphaera granulorum]
MTTTTGRSGHSGRPPQPRSVEPAAAGVVGGKLRWRTSRIQDPGALLDVLARRAPAASALAWVRREEGLVGWGEAARVEAGGEHRFATAAAAWRDLVLGAPVVDDVRLPGTGPVAFTSLSFDAASAGGGVLVVPEVLVGRRGGVVWVTTAEPVDASVGVAVGLGPESAEPESAGNGAPVEPVHGPGAVRYADGALCGPRWATAVARAVARIQAGELEKVVLARDLVAEAEHEVDPRWLLARLAAAYPSCWSFAVDGLVGATPELLVRRERGLVHSRVLAGTIRRTGDEQRDAALAGSLARSGKDLEEHEYAVRSVVSALAPHCRTTTAPDAPFVLHLPNVMHLASDVTGVLDDARPGGAPGVLELAAALHPTAAVCGTPTPSAAALIAELEVMDRDRYAGPVGWVDASGDGEIGLALRCARIDPDDARRVRLFAGCGVVAGSDPMAELAESDAKLVPVRDALGGA